MNRMISARGHHFLGSPLHRESIVVDCGAHLGEFSKELHDHFGCRCYAVEAMPDLYQRIPIHPHIQKFNFAVSAQDGMARFYVAANQEANSLKADNPHATTAIETPAIRLPTFMERHGLKTIDLLKLDIEGAEIEVLNSTPDEVLKACRQITVEFHDFIKGVVSAKDVQSVTKRLTTLGFDSIVFGQWDHADVLFINRSATGLSWPSFLYYKFVWKYLDGLRRILSRLKARS
jgi:FkbM family methyltransferase